MLPVANCVGYLKPVVGSAAASFTYTHITTKVHTDKRLGLRLMTQTGSEC